MNIAHLSDLHYCGKYLDEVDGCVGAAIQKMHDIKPDAIVISGDSFEARIELHHPAVAAYLGRIHEMACIAPVLVLQGTYSHDVPGSLDVLKGIPRVCVADTICQVILAADDTWLRFEPALPAGQLPHDPWRAIFSCLPSVNKAAVAAAMPAEKAAESVGDVVADLMRSWGDVNEKWHWGPRIVVSHGTVNGCVTEHGVPMAGLDHEFSVGALALSNADAVMLGHIHKHQQWVHDGTVIAYPGSIGRLHFGEVGEKGWLLWEFTSSGAEAVELIPSPSKKMVEKTYQGLPDMDELRELAAGADGAYVRIRYQVDEEYRKDVDTKAIEALFEGAAHIKVEGRINPVQRQRAAGITQLPGLQEQLVMWCEQTDTDPGPLVARLEELQSGRGRAA